MNTPARFASLTVALGALLLLSGCYTARSAGTMSPRVEYQAAVMETSKGLEVTPQLLADLRASAINYLQENGFTKGGEYFLRINLTPDQPEETDQWVVLRISSLPTRTYTLLAAYPGADDYYPYDFYGYYNYGFPSFARYGYYDPFDYGYGYGYGGSYIPPGSQPNRYHKPGDKDNNRPPPTRTRWDGNHPSPDDKTRNKDYQPDPNNPRKRDTSRPRDNDHPRDNDGGPRWSNRGGNNNHPDTPHPTSSGSSSNYNPGSSSSSYSPPPAPSYSAPSYSPPPSPPPASHSESSTQVREERTLPQNEK